LDLAIETVNLTKRFQKAKSYREMLLRPFAKQDITALRNVSLSVKAGETFALVGPNGAGKTTLIKILSTLILPTAGDAFVAGHEVKRQPAEIKRRIGCVVAEERSFYWRLTGRQNLNFFAVLNNIPKAAVKERVDEVIAQVGLERHADKAFKAYSTGMKQRLAIGRALLADPEIVLFDEPTKSLDRPTAQLIRGLIADFATRMPKRTVFFATHDLQEAEELAGRLALLDCGELKACGTPAELRRAICERKRYTLRLRQPNERVANVLRQFATAGQPAGTRAAEGTCFLVEITNTGDISSVIRELVQAGAQIVECTPVKPSLGEVFDFLTRGGT